MWPFVTALPALSVAVLRSVVVNHPGIAMYVLTSMVYEGLRTFPRVKNARWHPRSFRNGYSGPEVPLLLTEKVAASAFCSLTGVFAAPVDLIEDVKRAELKARGLDPLVYGYTPRDVRGGNTYMSYLNVVMNSPCETRSD